MKLSADLINQTDFMQQKHSDLEKIALRSRSFQGVFDGESAEFFPSKLQVDSRATSALTFTFHTSIISTDGVMKGGSTAEGTEILRSTFELVVKEGEKDTKRFDARQKVGQRGRF